MTIQEFSNPANESVRAVEENPLDSPDRAAEITQAIQSKPALMYFYQRAYLSFQTELLKRKIDGPIVELGSGSGFLKSVIPQVETTDVLSYPGIDRVVDATQMPYGDASVGAFFMLNVFHHIPDAEKALAEMNRCLKPGGIVFIADQYIGFLSKPIFKHIHAEGFDDSQREWRFVSTGPLSGANGALTWIVFWRDLGLFESRFPKLSVIYRRPHSPLLYWLSGGLKSWTLVPQFLLKFFIRLDKILIILSEKFASFTDIVLEKKTS
jgi:SAM-dependent methyltransferase